MSLDGLVRRARELNERMKSGETAGIGGGRGDSDVSTHAVADNPLSEITTAAESRPVRDWEWLD